ncbi:hypothetical protein GCM10009676_39560 [Prauserella halophila]|uniref:Stress-response A/B barrel domain-containing protein n=1 Tax=Prauserella halophila TaxID=185641 RepID=A0ABN1WI38_9PSEU|nr:hypothetical protein [Prauserella halophila]
MGIRDDRATFAPTVDFEDEESYRRYDTNPQHVRLRAGCLAPLCSRIDRVQLPLRYVTRDMASLHETGPTTAG